MAILTGPEIVRQMGKGNIVVEPFDPKFINPNSIDLHLGERMVSYAAQGRKPTRSGPVVLYSAIDSRNPPAVVDVPLNKDGAWLLLPGRLYLASTAEHTETRGFVPYVDGRSSMGRVGLFCHVTAGRGDNGFRGRWTLELVVVEALLIYPGQRIAQLTYHTIRGREVMYGETDNSSGRYQDHEGASPIVLDKE